MNAPISTGNLYKRTDGAWVLCADLQPVGLAQSGASGDVHVASVGEWLGHPDGPFEFTEATFAEMVKNAAAQKTPMAFDYEHRTFNDTAPDSTAAGWVRSLSVRGSGDEAQLWASVEWTERAAGLIRAGEMRFCSPAFLLDAIDRQSGKRVGARLLNVALTNQPFLDGQTPITCAQRLLRASEDSRMPDDKQPDEPTKTAEQPDPAAALNALVESVAKAAGVDVAAAVAAMGDLGETIGRLVREALDRDGVPSEQPTTASEPQGQRLLRIQLDGQATQLRKLSEGLASVTAKLSERDARDAAVAKDLADKQDAERKAKIESDADAIIADGRARDTQRDDVVYLLTHRPDMVARTYGEKVVPLGTTQSGDEPAAVKKPDDESADVITLSERQQASYRRLRAVWSHEKALSHARSIESRAAAQVIRSATN